MGRVLVCCFSMIDCMNLHLHMRGVMRRLIGQVAVAIYLISAEWA
jgi:hypothetical protein